jgi:hypothetical protein
MPNKPTDNKFETVALLRDVPWAPIPKFFFRLRLAYPSLPDSWWTTLFYILNVTLGSPSGVKGTLAYSELPVRPQMFSQYKAALEGYGRLMTVETAGWNSKAGSTFILNADATESDWLDFHLLLHTACRQKMLDPKAARFTYEQIKAFFAPYSRPAAMRLPFWSLMMYRSAADKGSEWLKEAEQIDVWDDANWVERGFDLAWLHKRERAGDAPLEDIDEFASLTGGEIGVLVAMFHLAWTNPTGPYLPADTATLKDVVTRATLNHSALGDVEATDDAEGFHFANLLAKFTPVEIEGEQWIECPWLTEKWMQEREHAAVTASLQKDSRGPQLASAIAAWRERVLSKPKRETE